MPTRFIEMITPITDIHYVYDSSIQWNAFRLRRKCFEQIFGCEHWAHQMDDYFVIEKWNVDFVIDCIGESITLEY